MTPDDARAAAVRQFGNVASLQERAREAHGWVWLEQFGQDLRYARRSLLKSPGFTFTAALVLAVGIGSSAVVFSAVRGILVRPLPFSQADRLAWVFARNQQ